MTERSSGNAFPIQAGASRKMRGAARHAFRFLASGTLALAVNAAILALLNREFGFDPFLSRLMAISIAMVVGWLAHRNITFLLQCPPPFASLSHAQVSPGLLRPVMRPVIMRSMCCHSYCGAGNTAAALVFSPGLITMILSDIGMRVGMFGNTGSHTGLR